MALAEARAAWQRTANRYLVQEDAKRAPKLACCPSIRPSTNTTSDVNKPILESLKPFDHWSSNLSPNSKWWLQMQPSYGYQKALADEQLNSTEDKTCQVDQTKFTGSSFDDWFRNYAPADKRDFCASEEELKVQYPQNWKDRHVEEDNVGDVRNNDVSIYLESDKDFERYSDFSTSDRTAGNEKSYPRWRTADAEELALLVAQSSVDQVENCDLPWPQNNCVKKDLNVRVPLGGSSLSRDENSYSYGVGRVCKDLLLPLKNQTALGGDKPLRNHPTQDRTPGTQHAFEDDDESKAQILEALRHSQTRAREAEKAAKRVCEERERVLALLLRQESQIFFYEQRLHLMQLENTYLQLRNRKVSFVFPFTWPQKPQTKGGKLPKNMHKPYCKT